MTEKNKKIIEQINSGIIPEGYKKTKVGIIPMEWDLKYLGDISVFLDHLRKPVKEKERTSGIYPYYGASGIIDYVADYIFDGEYVLLGEDGANIIMRSSPLAFKANGKMWINNHAHVISPKENCDIDFLVNILESKNYEKFNSGTAQPKLNRESCENLLIPFPPLPEQQKISEILTTQDKLIELQERKIEQLKTLKKGYLQKMFPKKGCKYPELRFKGFTEPWEQLRLGEIIIVGNGMDYKDLDKGNIPVYGTGGYMLSVNKALSYDKDAIGIGRKGTINKPYILKAPFWTVDTLFYCIPNENYNLEFVYAVFQNIDWTKKDESTGVPSLSKVNINSIDVKTTLFEEQQKIGTFFTHLDTLITLHQRKLDKEKQKKKALMQLLLTGKVRVST